MLSLRAQEKEAWSRLCTTLAQKKLITWNDLVGRTINKVVGHFTNKCVFITTDGLFLALGIHEDGSLESTSLTVSEAAACKLFDEGNYSEWLIAGDKVRKHTKLETEENLIAEAIKVCGIDKVKAAVAAKEKAI